MFYRVENGNLVEAPDNGLKVYFSNPTKEQYNLCGYTDEVIEDEMPEITSGQSISESFEQIGDKIYKHFSVTSELE